MLFYGLLLIYSTFFNFIFYNLIIKDYKFIFQFNIIPILNYLILLIVLFLIFLIIKKKIQILKNIIKIIIFINIFILLFLMVLFSGILNCNSTSTVIENTTLGILILKDTWSNVELFNLYNIYKLKFDMELNSSDLLELISSSKNPEELSSRFLDIKNNLIKPKENIYKDYFLYGFVIFTISITLLVALQFIFQYVKPLDPMADMPIQLEDLKLDQELLNKQISNFARRYIMPKELDTHYIYLQKDFASESKMNGFFEERTLPRVAFIDTLVESVIFHSKRADSLIVDQRALILKTDILTTGLLEIQKIMDRQELINNIIPSISPVLEKFKLGSTLSIYSR